MGKTLADVSPAMRQRLPIAGNSTIDAVMSISGGKTVPARLEPVDIDEMRRVVAEELRD